jgi:UDP-N-acetyl-D-galactosamine dehydrogenase
MIDQLLNKTSSLCVIGLGYVGLPVALAFGRRIKVVGYDINATRLLSLQSGNDPNQEAHQDEFLAADISFTSLTDDIRECTCYIICVPTPVDIHNVPDLTLLTMACKTVGSVLKKGDYVVFESTVYPGCTEEDCVPIITGESGLKAGIDFKFGYSPERINPGDKEHKLENVIKVVSGNDDEALQEIEKLYSVICKSGVFKAPTIKVAEAAKVIENTQRDLNIALMNELSLIFDRLNINTLDVLTAAGTKWNFLNFKPGLVGGHCIGVDPYYLTHKASALGYSSKVITAGRYVNDNMPRYITDKILRYLLTRVGDIKESRVLILGATFKENVSDIRNSKVATIIQLLNEYSINTDVIDPLASSADTERVYQFCLTPAPEGKYDVVIIAVAHDEFKKLDENYFEELTHEHALIADLKGLYRNVFSKRTYWNL